MQPGVALPRRGQCDHVLRGIACGSNHCGVEVVHQRGAFGQHTDRVMVAAQQQQGHLALVQLRNQAVVQRAGVAGGGAGVKNITGNQHGIH